MKNTIFNVVLVSASLSSVSAWAHPGHAVEVVPASSVLHYALQPEHGLGMLLASALLVAIYLKLCQVRPAAARK